MARAMVFTGALVAVSDLVLWRRHVGWGLGLLLMLLVVGMLACNRRLLAHRAGRLLAAMLAGLALALVEAPTPLAILLALAGVASLAIAAEPTAFRSVGRWIGAHLAWAGQAMAGVASDAGFIGSAAGAGSLAAWMRRLALAWALPLAGGLVFLLLFASANPVLEGWLVAIDLGLVAGLPRPDRVVMWIVIAACVWLLLRTRLVDLDGWRQWLAAPPAGQTGPQEEGIGWLLDALMSPAAVLRALIVFNLLFAAQNAMDIAWLGGGLALPPGFTYAGYAHRSAYPLVVTALLAAAFVLIAFRSGSGAAASPALKLGMYVWIGQNVLLVGIAIWRTLLYVEVYSLTYLRVAAMIWMGLVAAGLVLVVVRFVLARDNSWLLGANLVTLTAVLCALCFVDVGRVIADFNVTRCRELGGQGQRLDIRYLAGVGPSALPALETYVRHLAAKDGETASSLAQARAVREALEHDLRLRLADGWGWTWRLDRTARRLDRMRGS